MPPEANAVRGELIPFPADRIMWIRPRPLMLPAFTLEPGQVAVVMEGMVMVYASRDAFGARYCIPPQPAKGSGGWRGHLVAAATGAALAALVLWCGL